MTSKNNISLLAAILKGIVDWRMWKVGKKTEPAILGGALNMFTYVASSLAVLIGLAIAHFWGILMAGAFAVLVVSALLLAGGIRLVFTASRNLVDASLPRMERETIEEILTCPMPPLRGFHKLRTRRVGRFKYLEAHLVVDGALSVEQAHGICDHLEEHIREKIPHSHSSQHGESGKIIW